jgi:hypothetical protein
MEKPKRSPWIIISIIGIVLICLCLCALAVGGGAAFLLSGSKSLPEKLELNLGGEQPQDSPSSPMKPSAQAIQPTAIQEQPAEPASEVPTAAKPAAPKPTPRKATAVKTPTEVVELENPETEPPAEESAPTGKQERTDSRIFDDFSSNYLEWYQYDSDSYSILIENGKLNFKIKTADNSAYAELPVSFTPYEFSFDVSSPDAVQDGSFGVNCNYNDDDNRYFLEFDLGTGEYTIAAKKDGVITPLTKKNSQGQYWQKTSALKTPASKTNHIAVSCYLNSITLFINNTLVDQVTVKTPLDNPGSADIFAFTYKGIEGDGYTVQFDNLEAYQPRQ